MSKAAPAEAPKEKQEPHKPICGLIMPISGIAGHPIYTEQHWGEVYCILKEAIEESGYEVRMVSESEGSSIIQESIVNNIYSDDIVVVDVSSKNPNVMFELGLRLAFDKPAVLIKDELTSYNFDTQPLQHEAYPSSMNYAQVQAFKNKIVEKVIKTHKAYTETGKSPFLENFGHKIKKGTIAEKEIGLGDEILRSIQKISNRIDSLQENYEQTNEADGSARRKMLSPDTIANRNKKTYGGYISATIQMQRDLEKAMEPLTALQKMQAQVDANAKLFQDRAK